MDREAGQVAMLFGAIASLTFAAERWEEGRWIVLPVGSAVFLVMAWYIRRRSPSDPDDR